MLQQNIDAARNEPLRRRARRCVNCTDGRRHFGFAQPVAFFLRADEAGDQVVLRICAAFGNQIFDIAPDPFGSGNALRPACFVTLGLHQSGAFLKGGAK